MPVYTEFSGTKLPKAGTPVLVKGDIGTDADCEGFLVSARYITARRAGARGIYKGWVPGAGGDLWWVEHDDGKVAVYTYHEVLIGKEEVA